MPNMKQISFKVSIYFISKVETYSNWSILGLPKRRLVTVQQEYRYQKWIGLELCLM